MRKKHRSVGCFNHKLLQCGMSSFFLFFCNLIFHLMMFIWYVFCRGGEKDCINLSFGLDRATLDDYD